MTSRKRRGRLGCSDSTVADGFVDRHLSDWRFSGLCLWLASEGFSLSVADPDIQELPQVALYGPTCRFGLRDAA